MGEVDDGLGFGLLEVFGGGSPCWVAGGEDEGWQHDDESVTRGHD